MHYRRRLRSRIIVSFLLLGFGLTAAFALATLALQSRLEGSLVDGWLQSEASNFLQFKRANPEEDAAFTFSRQIEAFAYRRDSANIPLGWRELPRGVHDLREVGPDGVLRDYKLAVQREPDMVTAARLFVGPLVVHALTNVLLVAPQIARDTPTPPLDVDKHVDVFLTAVLQEER